ncbi:MAG TPA: VWA domain-containing protein [Bryobacteraceae bacterium]|jgi:Ca-activated chloride channel family protein|nr:VWA domain-containing protein [Bryobacteraceae bacterium]
MRLLSSFLASLLLFCWIANPQTANPQTAKPPAAKPPANPSSGDDVTFRADTRLVVLPISVADKNGKLVTDLKQSSFKVFENGIEQPIKIFKREDVPISLGIIIDNSGSMKEKRQKVEIASLDMVKASNPQDEVFIVNFNDQPWLDVPMTSDIKAMQEGIARIDSRGGTAMRDAISGGIDYLKKEGKRQKKVLLVITDGNDNASTINLERLVNRSQQNEILIFSIGLLNEEERHEAKIAKRALDTLSRETGGLAFYPKGVADVDQIALQVAHEIRNQYTLAYSPTSPEMDGSFRQIKVTVNGPGHPLVRTRTGYYATPNDSSKKAVSQTLPR